MTYTKPWATTDLAKEDSWVQWLNLNAIPDLDYALKLEQGQLTLEFFDWAQAQEFAQDFGL